MFGSEPGGRRAGRAEEGSWAGVRARQAGRDPLRFGACVGLEEEAEILQCPQAEQS